MLLQYEFFTPIYEVAAFYFVSFIQLLKMYLLLVYNRYLPYFTIFNTQSHIQFTTNRVYNWTKIINMIPSMIFLAAT